MMNLRSRLVAAFAVLIFAAFFSSCSVVSTAPIHAPPSEKQVLAFYYPWFGTPSGPSGKWVHWEPRKPRYTSTNTPLSGFYDSLDERTIERHIREAREAGLDGLIASWWGMDRFEDRALDKLIAVAERDGFQICVYYEHARNREQVYQDLRYLAAKHGRSKAFLKVGGRPVVFFYVRAVRQFSPNEWREIFQRLANDGLAPFSIADGFTEDLLHAFDGVHTYNPVIMPFRDLWALYLDTARKAKALGKLFAATVLPGYDDRFVRQPGFAQGRLNGRYYRDLWHAATDSEPHWILITSFNEWHEGSEIEPSVEFGDEYLKLTRQLTDRWKRKGR